jgi:hypothetical protein
MWPCVRLRMVSHRLAFHCIKQAQEPWQQTIIASYMLGRWVLYLVCSSSMLSRLPGNDLTAGRWSKPKGTPATHPQHRSPAWFECGNEMICLFTNMKGHCSSGPCTKVAIALQ